MIVRDGNKKDYTIMCTDYFQDKNLSLTAKGLFSLLLSLSDEELKDCSLEGLAKLSKDDVDSVRAAFIELIEHGYIENISM